MSHGLRRLPELLVLAAGTCGYCCFSWEDVGLSGEKARNIIKNVSMNALSRQPVFQDADSVVSEIHVLVGGTGRAEVLAQGRVEKTLQVPLQWEHQPPRSSSLEQLYCKGVAVTTKRFPDVFRKEATGSHSGEIGKQWSLCVVRVILCLVSPLLAEIITEA